jgi:tRNA dimethylallyltransferase
VLAHAAIDELVDENGAVVVAGGTGLYLRAALADLQLPPAPAEGARER